jgi:hypothetical protein
MFNHQRQVLASYEAEYTVAERHFRTKRKDWLEVMVELHLDRGTLLGSNEYEELSGVERATALGTIDAKISEAHHHIKELENLRDEEVKVPTGFKHRCKRILSRISMLDDKTLGVKE